MFICPDVISVQGCLIFLQSRYDPVLEAGVTYTDDLAYNHHQSGHRCTPHISLVTHSEALWGTKIVAGYSISSNSH